MNKKVTFLFGAGAESNFGLPSGAEFKRDTIVAKDVKEFSQNFNTHKNFSNYKFDNGTILKYNSSSVLYQTVKECSIDSFNFSDEDKRILQKYDDYKSGRKYANRSDDNKKTISEEFQKLYKRKIYDKIKNPLAKNDNYTDYFLENAKFFSFIDSYFNYLRFPKEYPKQVAKVIKLYFSAYKSIIDKMSEKLYFSPKSDNIIEFRVQFTKWLINAQKLMRESIPEEQCYYKQIEEILSDNTITANIVTCNYTTLAEEIIKHNNEIFYLHGKMDLFENVITKEIKPLTDFAEDDFVMPYILIQSGVKPIISPEQLKAFSGAIKAFEESNTIVILGYGVNSDDEHITSMLRPHVKEKKIVYFIYQKNEEFDKEKKRICSIFGIDENSDYIDFGNTEEDFQNYLNALKTNS